MRLRGQWVIDRGGLFVGHGGFMAKGRLAHKRIITLNKGNELRSGH